MITRKDLKNRQYENEKCVAFDFIINVEEYGPVELRFKRDLSKLDISPIMENQWQAQMILKRDSYSDSQVYGFEYQVPNNKVPLETIAGMGLRFIQLKMKEDVQLKSTIDFTIGEFLMGMLGEPI
jgi:hypothetical protein